MALSFRLRNPFSYQWTPTQTDIDHYGHVNNVSYVKALETTAWAHSNTLGLNIDIYKSLDAGMAITHHSIDYLLAVKLGESIQCDTGLIACDQKLRLSRGFIFYNQDKHVILRAQTDFVCISLSTGKPRKMPEAFREFYGDAFKKQGQL